MWRSPAVSWPSGTRMFRVIAVPWERACSSIHERAAVVRVGLPRLLGDERVAAQLELGGRAAARHDERGESAAVDAAGVETRGIGMQLWIFAGVVTEDDVRRPSGARGPGRTPLAAGLARVRNGAERDEMVRILVAQGHAWDDAGV